MAGDNRCPNCGAERPADSPEGLCPRCLMRPTLVGETPAPVDATEGGPGATQPDDEATLARTVGPTTGPATAAWTPDPAETADGGGAARDLPRGAVVRYFGDYEVQTELGRGGMGVVYRARQVSLNRSVALKVIKAGVLADDAELRRFQNEAEAVALLDHPGIVPVYEVGEHGGRRYFSMKLVEGGTLAEQLASFGDDPKAAATLLAEAAEAVHHAHMRGILHRDLKPANILVDPEGRPHVTDFGLAKRVEADAEMTASGAILGTPAYMSPEQAAGRRGTITTATDVYGLGAILYAVLTGKAPFGGDSVLETLDAVRSRPPEPPTRLNGRVSRDLETVCLKCLEKDPRRRYSSAQALADDLHAWLTSRPIAARRVKAAERAWLWCKRKPAVAALTAAVLLAVVGGTAAVIAVQAKANADLRAANVRETQRFDLAMDAIKLFHGEVSEDLLMKETQFDGLRTRLLKGAADFYGRLEELLKGQTDRKSRAALGESYAELAGLTAKIGDQPAALAVHRKALAVRRALASEPGADAGTKLDVARTLNEAGWLQRSTGDTVGARASFEEARRLAEGVGTRGGADEQAQEVLGRAYHRIAYVQSETGGPAEALATYGRALAIRQKLADADPGVTRFQLDLAMTHNNIGWMLSLTGDPAEVRAANGRALAIRQKLADANPGVTQFQVDLALSHTNMGSLLLETGDTAGARAAWDKALAIRRKLADGTPGVTQFQRDLADSYGAVGNILAGSGDTAGVRVAYGRALAIRQKLADANPGVTQFQRDLADSHTAACILLSMEGDTAGALAALREGLAIHQRLADANPGVTEFQRDLANCHNNIYRTLHDMGDTAGARAAQGRMLTIQQTLADANPGVTLFQRDLAVGHMNIAWLLSRTGDAAGAQAAWDRALAIQQKLAEADPNSAHLQRDLAMGYNAMATLLSERGELAGALPAFDRALAIQQTLADANPAELKYRREVVATQNNLSHLLRKGRHPAEARDGYDRALLIGEALARENPENSWYQTGPGFSLRGRGLARVDLGDVAGGAADTRRALQIWDGLPTRSGEHWFETACCHATLAALAGRDRSGDSAGEASAGADKAMALLNKAVGMGYREFARYKDETALDGLRGRDDFRLLLMDLAMPAPPFTP